MKKTISISFLFAVFFFFVSYLPGQTIGQMSFIIKNALPQVENVAVIFNNNIKARIETEARSAVVITKLNIQIYGIDTRADIANQLQNISTLKNAAVILVSDGGVMNPDSAKFIAQRLGMRKIPVFSDRKDDTWQGVLVTVEKAGDEMRKFVSSKITAVLGINLNPAFLEESISVE